MTNTYQRRCFVSMSKRKKENCTILPPLKKTETKNRKENEEKKKEMKRNEAKKVNKKEKRRKVKTEKERR